MKYLLVIWLLIFPINAIFAAPTTDMSSSSFEIDMSAANAILTAFEKGHISPQELEEILQLDAIKASIKQTSRFNKEASVETYKQTLLKILAGEELKQDPFQFNRVRENLVAIKSMYQEIQQNPQELMSEVERHMSNYLPKGLKFNVVVHMLVGGGSDGFSRDEHFYVALQYFEGDYAGLKVIMAHELYHVAQEQFFMPAEDSSPVQAILSQTLREGSASLVGDPLKVSGGEYVKWFQEKFRRNLSRIEQNYLLLELILYRLSNEPESNFEQYYSLGFSGSWDSPLYFVGYNMAKTILQYKGAQKLVELYSRTPAAFFKEYITLYKAKPNADIVHFSSDIEEIIFAN